MEEKIKSIQDIIKILKVKQNNNEELYKISDLKKELLAMKCEELQAFELIITPYYCLSGKIYELYAFELNIAIVVEKNFNKYLLALTGQSKIEDVPVEVKKRQEICYIELTDKEVYFQRDKIMDYIEYIQNSKLIKEEVSKYFSEFLIDSLYFQIY